MTKTSHSEPLDPRIGILANGTYCCFANGYNQPETIGTLAEVQAALGIGKAAPTGPQRPTPRTYSVTVTPAITIYAGTNTFGQYTVQVQASTRSQAISLVRQQRRDQEGRYAVPATYRARLLD
jgi:hypothetical protein